jgi:uncharacterized protein YrrD
MTMEATFDMSAAKPFPSQKLRSLEVVAVREGRFVGRVRSEICDPRDHVLLGLTIARRDGAPESFVSLDHIRRLGPHAVTVDRSTDLHRIEDHPRAQEVVDARISMYNAPVIAEDGERIGRLRSVWLDRGGNVVAYDVAKGALGFVHATKVLPNDIVVIGPDAIVVHDSVRRAHAAESTRDRAAS